MERRAPTPRIAPLLGLLALSVYGLTGSTLAYGYIGRHFDEARAWVRGSAGDPYMGGVLEILACVPSALVERIAGGAAGQLALALVHPAVGALICVALYGFAFDLYRRSTVAAGIALAAAFGTMLWPYAKFGMEDMQTLFTLLSAWTLWRFDDAPSRRRAIAFGAAMGALALTKATGVVHCFGFAAAGAVLFARRGMHRSRERRIDSLAAAAVGAAALAVLFATNLLRFDGLLIGNRYNAGTELTLRHAFDNVAGSLFGAGKSVFLFSPPLLVGCAGLCAFLRRFPSLRPAAWAMLGVALWYGFFSAHFMDETWGVRRFHFLVPLMMLPAGIAFERFRRLRPPTQVAVVAAVVAGIGVQALAVSFNYGAHFFAMGRTPIYTIRNNVWSPDLNAIRFNAHLARSLAGRALGGEPLPYVVAFDYVPWDAPEHPPAPLAFDVTGHDRLDFWWWRQVPGATPLVLAPLTLCAAAAAGVLLARRLRTGDRR